NQTSAIAPDAQTNQGSANDASSPSSAAPGANAAAPGGTSSQVAGSAAPSAYRQLMLTLVQQASTQLTTALVTKMTTGSGNKSQAQYPTFPAADPLAAAQPVSTTAAAQPQVPASSDPYDSGNPSPTAAGFSAVPTQVAAPYDGGNLPQPAPAIAGS